MACMYTNDCAFSLLLWISGDNLLHVCIPMIVHFLRGWFIDN